MERFVVIGLGAFGASIARRLHERGAEVMAVDSDERNVDDLKDHVSRAVIADATDRDALEAIGVRQFSTAIVAIGENREANILVTALLKEMGIPRIVARATGPLHARILTAVGVDRVVSPELDFGRRLADTLSSSFTLERVPLAEGLELGEFAVNDFMAGRTLRELNLRGQFRLNVVAIQRANPEGAAAEGTAGKTDAASLPDPDEKLRPGDVLVLLGAEEALDALVKKFGD